MKTSRVFDIINWLIFFVTFPLSLVLDSWWPVLLQWAMLGGMLVGTWLGFRQHDEWDREREERAARQKQHMVESREYLHRVLTSEDGEDVGN